MSFRDECGLCGRVLSYRYLRKCQRCGRVYCRDCMTPDVSTGDPTKMLCLNCARRIVSPRTVSKYGGLTNYLKFRGSFTDTVQLSFSRIDGIIGDNLPMQAYKMESWWDNAGSTLQAKSWREAGWEVQSVNLKEAYVVFHKVRDVQPRRLRKKATGNQIKKPFTPVRVRTVRSKVPSKTKVSKLYARIKNLERRRTAMPKYHGSFKPKPRHEQRLYKPDEKPQ